SRLRRSAGFLAGPWCPAFRSHLWGFCWSRFRGFYLFGPLCSSAAKKPRSNPLRQLIVSLLQVVRISLPVIQCIWASLRLPLGSLSGSARGRCLLRPQPCSVLPIGSTFPLKKQKCVASSRRQLRREGAAMDMSELLHCISPLFGKSGHSSRL